jgi:hypothetical protein
MGRPVRTVRCPLRSDRVAPDDVMIKISGWTWVGTIGLVVALLVGDWS